MSNGDWYSIPSDRHLRILHISTAFPPKGTGGVAAHVDYLVRALHELRDVNGDRACSVRVLTAGDEKASGQEQSLDRDLSCYALEGVDGRFAPSGEIPLGKTVYKALRLWSRLWPDRGGADVIHVHDFESAYIGMMLKSAYQRTKLVMTVHKTPKEWDRACIRHKVKDCYLQMMLAHQVADRMIAASRAYAERLRSQIRDLVEMESVGLVSESYRNRLTTEDGPGRMVETIHHGVPIDRLLKVATAPDVLKRMRLSEDEVLILMPCRLDPHKNPETFVEAAALLKNRAMAEKLVFAITDPGESGLPGDTTNYRNKILNLVSYNGVDEFVRVGPVDGNGVTAAEMPTLYRKARICVVPSRRDGLPQVVMEAFAFKVPVIGANIGGIPDMIASETNGLLFDQNEPVELAEKIERLLDNPGLARALAMTGFETACWKFNANRMARKCYASYSDLVFGPLESPK